MRGGITSLDMNVLLDGSAAKGREKRDKPGLEKEFFLFEEKDLENPKEAEKPASFGSYRDRRKQNISDSIAKKAGATENVFDKIEHDWQEYRAKENAREEREAEGFGKDFLSYFEEQKKPKDYITNKQAGGKITVPSKGYGSRREWYEQSSNDYRDRYNAANEYVMSTGDNAFENTVKGSFNNFRSSIGGLVEDTAYLISDYAPWYKPAQKVISDNTAGNIKDTAEKQFENAKKNTGEVGDKLIDAADSFSESMGYSLFGLNAGTYLEAAGESTKEYRQLRESGYSEEEALRMAMGKAMIAVLSAKADDYVGKNNLFDENYYMKHGNNKLPNKKTLKNSAGNDIIEVDEVDVYYEPNSITQKTNAKGGSDRNFYDETGRQYKQISNNGHGHPKEEALGEHGEHAHDYVPNDRGKPEHQPARELTYLERKENSDFLWENQKKKRKR